MHTIVELLDQAVTEHENEHGATDYELAFALAMDLARYSRSDAPDAAAAIALANCFATWIEQIHRSQRDQDLADTAVRRISQAFDRWSSEPHNLAKFAESLRSSIECVNAAWIWESGGDLRRSSRQEWMKVKRPGRSRKSRPES